MDLHEMRDQILLQLGESELEAARLFVECLAGNKGYETVDAQREVTISLTRLLHAVSSLIAMYEKNDDILMNLDAMIQESRKEIQVLGEQLGFFPQGVPA